MKRFGVIVGVLAVVACVAALAAQSASSPDNRPAPTAPPTQAYPPAPAQQLAPPVQPARAGHLGEVTSGSFIRASQLIGMKIQNHQGQNLGAVSDIVIDATSGTVRYVALSDGGVLGLNEKLLVVPWGALQYTHGEDAGQHLLVLRATDEQLKTAATFDQNNWPDFTDHNLTMQLDRHFGVEYQAGRGGGSIDVQVGPGGVNVDVERRPRGRTR